MIGLVVRSLLVLLRLWRSGVNRERRDRVVIQFWVEQALVAYHQGNQTNRHQQSIFTKLDIESV